MMAHKKLRAVTLFSIVMLSLSGCSSSYDKRMAAGQDDKESRLTQQEIVNIAKNEAQRLEFKYSDNEKDIDVEFREGHWWVFLFAEDIRRQGRIGFLISPDGEIVKIFKSI